MPVYAQINNDALLKGYTFYTIPEFYEKFVLKSIQPDKAFIHRHDIDTDPKTAKLMFETELKLGIKSSYYFRLSTVDIEFMKKIHDNGYEVGYHYEEIAQYCKDYKLKSLDQVLLKMTEIQERFSTNFLKLEKSLGFKIKTIASHGDFVNRKLGYSNFELIDKELMSQLGIDLECYNKELLASFDVKLSDYTYPHFYRDKTVEDAFVEGANVIYLLTHPRHWRAAPWINTKDNFQRLMEGIKYGK